MTEKAGLAPDRAVFCLQSSVILTFICVIDSNCVRFHSRSSLLAIALRPARKQLTVVHFNGSFLVAWTCVDESIGWPQLHIRISKEI